MISRFWDFRRWLLLLGGFFNFSDFLLPNLDFDTFVGLEELKRRVWRNETLLQEQFYFRLRKITVLEVSVP